MTRGLVFHLTVACDQPGCAYVLERDVTYTGHVLDQLYVRIDQLDYHRSKAHPDVYAAECAALSIGMRGEEEE